MSEPTKKPRIVAVLGGNAFASPGERLTMAGQLRFAQEAMEYLSPLVNDDTELLISHGNGPQVGHILARVEAAAGQAYSLPLEVCVAESEGELGYVLEQALHNVLAAQGRSRAIAALLTHVVVDEDDEGIQKPAKPIGAYFDRATAMQMQSRGMHVMEDAGRGFRRVVPSPHPREVVELDVIDRLLTMGVIVIAAGGGGIPVTRRNGRLAGVEAVIDKDRTACLLAELLGAELLVILTCVPFAYRYFGTKQQAPIGIVEADHARRLIQQGHFAAGSMLPKMEAATAFASAPGRRTIICDPPSLALALEGKAGTIIVPSSRKH